MVRNGSDKIIVFGTYVAPTSSSTSSWGSMTGCHILPMETASNVDRAYETEDLKYKAGIDVALTSDGTLANQTTITETTLNSIKYSISGSCYAKNANLKTWEVSIDALRTWADGGDAKTVAIFSRPTQFSGTSTPTTADDYVALWGEPDLVMDAMVSSYSEPANVGESVKVDLTLSQVGELKSVKKTSWPA